MNWVFILVVLILLYHIVRGYKRGLLRIAYSLVSWIIVLVFVMWATPYVKSYIMENTSVFERIQNSCSEQLRNSMQEKQEAQLEDDAGDAVNGELAELGIGLPDSVITGLLEKAGGAADTLFEESGIYDELAAQIADFIVQGIATFLALTAAWILVHILAQILGIVSHIPILSGINRTLGIFAGGLYGLILVWIAFYIIAVCSASEIGRMLISYIYESRLLTWIYENNIVLTLFMYFL